MAVVIRGTNSKPVSSDALAAFYSKPTAGEGNVFVGFPVIGTPDGRYSVDALCISPQKGIIIFDLIEGNDVGSFAERQDDLANKLEARLENHRELIQRRELLIPIHTISFAPGIRDISRFADASEYAIANLDTLPRTIDSLQWASHNDGIYRAALSAIQSISTIRKSRTRRAISNPHSRGAKLKTLEDSIATLDNLQSKAVIETVDGVQRIRGLAGSGKTIVLALKAAYLHVQHPDWRIAITFNTRSLKGQFKRLINTFVIEQAGEEPDWDRIRIINAWGAPGGPERDGIYYEFCRIGEATYYDYRTAKRQFAPEDAFAGACERALREYKPTKSAYDAILIDEAQDFPPAFLRLCYEMLDEHKRLVYAYDELQNLSGQSMLPPEDIFGKNSDGTPRVPFDVPEPGKPRRDIILDKCYRNSRPVLATAHALGFGIYREPAKPNGLGLVQMFDHSQLWQEIGYHLKSGRLEDGAEVVLERTPESSPLFLEEHSQIDDLIQFHNFENEEEQTKWLTAAIQTNLNEDELNHDDIVVINPEPISTREKVGPVRANLLELGTNSHLAGVDTDPDIFFQQDVASITFTGIYRAKGNEAGMVYIINAQDCNASFWNLASIRNRLFTAITRSKAWVRVLGIGEGMRALTQEYEKLKARNFELRFRYPTAEERKQLAIVHRDMSVQERRRLSDRERNLTEMIADMEAGKLFPEDLDEALLERFKKMLEKRG